MNGRITVCYKCTQRHPYCHDSCPQYQQQKAEHDRLHALELQRAHDDSLFYRKRYDR